MLLAQVRAEEDVYPEEECREGAAELVEVREVGDVFLRGLRPAEDTKLVGVRPEDGG